METIRVETSGEAFLRNGYSKVTALGTSFQMHVDWAVEQGTMKMAEIFVVNSLGRVTNGYIWVPETAVMELAQKLLARQRPVVHIEVEGGVASVESCPDWIGVEIVDLDV